jgi:hypothetical protein
MPPSSPQMNPMNLSSKTNKYLSSAQMAMEEPNSPIIILPHSDNYHTPTIPVISTSRPISSRCGSLNSGNYYISASLFLKLFALLVKIFNKFKA